MSAYKSPADLTGGLLGVKQILDSQTSRNPDLKHKLDAFVILNLAQNSNHKGAELRKFILQETNNLKTEKEWDKSFSPSKIEINDREILTYKKVTKVSKAIHAAFNSAVLLAEPNPETSNSYTFSNANRKVVTDKIVNAISQIEGLSVDRTTKASLTNQIQAGLESVTNDQRLTLDLMQESVNTITAQQQKTLDKTLAKENNVSRDKQNEHRQVSTPNISM
ncbi:MULTISPECIES: hypothetical protein [Acinetobacter]|uniref:Uncharacterized protein n=1 Tax=Acinetobacter indicus TaxID=756892 RepID=A0A6C0Y6D3_9GAMM|nr:MULTISPECIES: hypothetical protein [Acinetobacter]QIC71686.1 hypothetical protein FSC09_14925 [Acinetobacter indicus]QKQ71595.1 hypothetical protein E5Y90_15290 [Acinetobacter sp. 10FS3-1]